MSSYRTFGMWHRTQSRAGLTGQDDRDAQTLASEEAVATCEEAGASTGQTFLIVVAWRGFRIPVGVVAGHAVQGAPALC